MDMAEASFQFLSEVEDGKGLTTEVPNKEDPEIEIRVSK